MLRRLINLLTLLSLLLCVAVVVLWMRSYWASDWATVELPRPAWDVGQGYVFTRRGGVGVVSDKGGALDLAEPEWITRSPMTYGAAGWPEETLPNRAGFSAMTVPLSRGVLYSASVPCWFLALITGAAPVAWLLHNRRARHRTRAGYCRSCGYDLRATPGRCPECGTDTKFTPAT
jgi:hypothetical protein